MGIFFISYCSLFVLLTVTPHHYLPPSQPPTLLTAKSPTKPALPLSQLPPCRHHIDSNDLALEFLEDFHLSNFYEPRNFFVHTFLLLLIEFIHSNIWFKDVDHGKSRSCRNSDFTKLGFHTSFDLGLATEALIVVMIS